MYNYNNVRFILSEDKKTATIIYIGNLCKEDTKQVHIHYGHGLLWENVSELKMDKIDDLDISFETVVEIPESLESFHCCFRTDSNEWDNNEGQNYNFELEQETTTVSKTEDDAQEIFEEQLAGLDKFGKNLSMFFYNLFKSIPQLFRKLQSIQIDID